MTQKTTHQFAQELLALPDIPLWCLYAEGVLVPSVQVWYAGTPDAGAWMGWEQAIAGTGPHHPASREEPSA